MNVFCFFFYVFHGRKELFLAFIVVFHGRKEVIVKKPFVPRGRQAFFLHFLASSTGEEYSFYIFSPWRKSCWPRPCGVCSCPACESIARQRQRVCRAIARRLALDSSRLKSTEDQGENWTSQHQCRSFTSIIRNVSLAGWLLSCQNSIIKSKNKEKNLAISENVHTFAPHLRTMLGKTETSHLKEGWVSGWNQQFAKLPCEFSYRGFESPSFRRQCPFKCKLIGRFI